MMKWLSLLAVFALAGCPQSEEKTTITVVDRQLIPMRIVSLDRPKHFRIVAQELESGRVHEYSSMWCNPHRKYEVGATVEILVRTMKYSKPIPTADESIKTEIRSVAVFCES